MFERSRRFVVSKVRCGSNCDRPSSDCDFRIAWAINPHMQIGSVPTEWAEGQHRTFVRTLERAGAQVEIVPFVHGAFDSVFSKDNAVIVERGGHVEALLGQPRFAERTAEQRARAGALGELGAQAITVANHPLEGGDVVVLPGARGAFLGHGFRSTEQAAKDLEGFLGFEVTALELRDERLYHLDMALAVLDDGTALVCEEALTPAALRAVERHPAVQSIIRVELVEALKFGVNLVQIDRTIVWGADAPVTSRTLEERGYVVQRVALDAFHRAGGSAACLVSRIHRQGVSSDAPLASSNAA